MTGEADFGNHELLWATVGFTITLSVVVHGMTGAPFTLLYARRDQAHGGRTKAG